MTYHLLCSCHSDDDRNVAMECVDSIDDGQRNGMDNDDVDRSHWFH